MTAKRSRPYAGPAPMTRAANAGLRRRLTERTAAAIEAAKGRGDWKEVERLTAAHLSGSARIEAAALAKLPIDERYRGDFETLRREGVNHDGRRMI